MFLKIIYIYQKNVYQLKEIYHLKNKRKLKIVFGSRSIRWSRSIRIVKKFSFQYQKYMQSSAVYVKTEYIHCTKLLINVYFPHIRLFS